MCNGAVDKKGGLEFFRVFFNNDFLGLKSWENSKFWVRNALKLILNFVSSKWWFLNGVGHKFEDTKSRNGLLLPNSCPLDLFLIFKIAFQPQKYSRKPSNVQSRQRNILIRISSLLISWTWKTVIVTWTIPILRISWRQNMYEANYVKMA